MSKRGDQKREKKAVKALLMDYQGKGTLEEKITFYKYMLPTL